MYRSNCKIHFLTGSMGLLLALLSSAPAFAQEGRVNFPSMEMEVSKAVQIIERQSGYVFSYPSESLDVLHRIAFTRQELSVKDAVKQLLAGKNLDYMVHSKYIIIHPVIAPPEPSLAPKSNDTYQSTDAITALPLNQPVVEAPEAAEICLPETEPVAEVAYSAYYSPEVYRRADKYLPFLALKTNLLYAIGTLTPNLAMEFGISPKTSLQLAGSYNPWNRIGTLENNDKLVHWTVQPEFRYWFCERFNGHFLGVNAFYNQFNVSGKNIPFIDFKKDFRYEGFAVGTGIGYGYHLLLGGRWGLEFSAGVGIIQARYDLFECLLCSEILEEKTKTWFGPTHLSVGLEFIIK